MTYPSSILQREVNRLSKEIEKLEGLTPKTEFEKMFIDNDMLNMKSQIEQINTAILKLEKK